MLNASDLTRAPAFMVGALGLSIGLVALEIATGHPPKMAVALTISLSIAALTYRVLSRWRNLVGATLLIILFIPMRRYGLPASLPFDLEPYRLLIAAVAVLWAASLLADPTIRIRRSIIDLPLAAVICVAAASIGVNAGHFSQPGLTSVAVKALTFLFSFYLFFYFMMSVIRTKRDIDFVIRVFVGGGTIVAMSALVELWTHFNVFDHLDQLIPILSKTEDSGGLVRGGYIRVFASAQHPIALGSLFALLMPLAAYLFMSTRRAIWLGATFIFCIATVATVSRTGVLSLVVVGIVYVVLRPRQMIRFWPLLLPALLVIKIAMPGVLGTFYHGFFPRGGLVAEQADGAVGSSRIASFRPAIDEVSKKPLLGVGYGARIPSGPGQNSFIVDDQWLSTAMETGVLGVGAWVWLFVVFLRKMFRAARRDRGPRGWLYASIAASTTGFAVGMATYDAFSFTQVTFGLFVVLALGCAALRAGANEPEAVRS